MAFPFPNRNSRQEPLKLVLPASVSVIGCGGVGSWVALFLALAGVPRIQLWDDDVVSVTNLNRLPLGPDSVGRSKAVALTFAINRLVPTCMVEANAKWTPKDESRPTWCVVSTDTWASRREAFKWAEEKGVRYIEASAEGEYGGITGRPADFATPEEDNPGYASVPVHVGPCIMAAGMVCYYILHNLDLGVGAWRIGWKKGLDIKAFAIPKPRLGEASNV